MPVQSSLKRVLRIFGIAGALLTIAACSSTVDLSRDGGVATDYVPGSVYVLLHDRYLEYQGWPTGVGRPVVVASSVTYLPGTAPSSIEAYQATPSRWPHIVGVLSAGTRLRLQRIERHSYPMLEDWFEVYAVVEEGEFRGRDVDLTRISARVPDSRMLRVDTHELRLMSADAGAR